MGFFVLLFFFLLPPVSPPPLVLFLQTSVFCLSLVVVKSFTCLVLCLCLSPFLPVSTGCLSLVWSQNTHINSIEGKKRSQKKKKRKLRISVWEWGKQHLLLVPRMREGNHRTELNRVGQRLEKWELYVLSHSNYRNFLLTSLMEKLCCCK